MTPPPKKKTLRYFFPSANTEAVGAEVLVVITTKKLPIKDVYPVVDAISQYQFSLIFNPKVLCYTGFL